jgi:hypothetical protein
MGGNEIIAECVRLADGLSRPADRMLLLETLAGAWRERDDRRQQEMARGLDEMLRDPEMLREIDAVNRDFDALAGAAVRETADASGPR